MVSQMSKVNELVSSNIGTYLTNQQLRTIFINPRDFGAKGDRVTNDTAAFNEIESKYTDKLVYIFGLTYIVDVWPTKNMYIDGFFKINGNVYGSGYNISYQTSNANVFIGRSSGENFTPNMTYMNTGAGHNLTAVGQNSLKNANQFTKHNTAIGAFALESNVYGFYDIGVGYNALKNLNGVSGNDLLATRNVAVGDHSMLFLTQGYSNVAMGRNALQVNTTGYQNVAVGGGSMSGYAPLDLDGITIVNGSPSTAYETVALGFEALYYSGGFGNSSLGTRSGREIKRGVRNTSLGYEALSTLEKNVYPDGRTRTFVSLTGTYSKVETTITVTVVSHGFAVGDTILIGLNGTEASYNDVTNVANANTFTIVSRVNINNIANTGTVSISERVLFGTSNDPSDYSENTAIGVRSMYQSTKTKNNVAIGGLALSVTSGNDNTAAGYLALTNNTTGTQNTALGYGALRFLQDGTNQTTTSHSVGIGYNSRVSGDDQIQLGQTGSTTYVYGTVQTRSDIRDKTEIRDTLLGLEFINSLRPVDYKWNYRDDYLVEDDDGNLVRLENDGSKTRVRYHHGLIAQEVKEVMDGLGIDFGGYQDHTVKGGCDVLTLGYEELISPLIKAVQELSARVKALESK